VSAVLGGDSVKISLDDAVSDEHAPRRWVQSEHVTSKEISRDSFEKCELSEKELADLGHYILARLGAFLERDEL
jgi:hypothetical protein